MESPGKHKIKCDTSPRKNSRAKYSFQNENRQRLRFTDCLLRKHESCCKYERLWLLLVGKVKKIPDLYGDKIESKITPETIRQTLIISI